MLRSLSAILAVFAMAAGCCQAVMACGPEVRIQFTEQSPDRFRITFAVGPKLRLVSLHIDLGGSAGGAFFDGNDGLEMQGAQPNTDGVALRSVAYDRPGGAAVALTFENFVEGRTADFASDLDDRGLGADPDQNHIVDGELEGATARAVLLSETGRRIEIDGRFDKKSYARVGDRSCV